MTQLSVIEAEKAQREPTVMQILADAVMREQNPVSVEVIERLVAMQRQVAQDQAEQEFNEAMNRCQRRMKRIEANMTNPQTRSRYANYEQIDKAIRPIYIEEGLSLSFSEKDPPSVDYIRLVCYVSRGLYTRTYQKDMPIVTVGPQGKAVMTPTHAHGSADAYAKRYLVKDIFNLAVGEADDDGNMGGSMDEREFIDLADNIEAAGSLVELETIFKGAYRAAMEARDQQAQNSFIEKKDKRKKELKNAVS